MTEPRNPDQSQPHAIHPQHAHPNAPRHDALAPNAPAPPDDPAMDEHFAERSDAMKRARVETVANSPTPPPTPPQTPPQKPPAEHPAGANAIALTSEIEALRASNAALAKKNESLANQNKALAAETKRSQQLAVNAGAAAAYTPGRGAIVPFSCTMDGNKPHIVFAVDREEARRMYLAWLNIRATPAEVSVELMAGDGIPEDELLARAIHRNAEGKVCQTQVDGTEQVALMPGT